MNQDQVLLINFLPQLVEQYATYQQATLASKKKMLSQLFEGLLPLQDQKATYDRQHAPRFNVFGLLRYGHYETRLHTPLLFSLLNPRGTHQLKDRFLHLFLSNIFEDNIPYSEVKHFQITEELSVGELGQIDIFISFNWNKKDYCIAIENKINAVDQPEQLERYMNYMIQKFPHATKKLIYLSKSGKYPSSFSINNELMNKLLQQDVLHLRSYKTDVIRWIDQLLNESIPDVVKFTLVQYKQTIKTLNHD